MLPNDVQAFIDHEIAANTTDYSDLRAVFLNGTLKRSPEPSHTDGLIAISRHILEGVGVQVDTIRTVDHVIPPGVQPDMREHGWERDDFPQLFADLVEPANIVVLASPIWLGDQSSMTRLAIERLYGYSGKTNDRGQWSYYGTVGGALVTGNEDGAKHCAAQMLYALSHIGLTAAGRLLLGRGGGSRRQLSRRRDGRAQQLDHAQHGVHDLEPATPGAHAPGRGRDPGVRKRHPQLGPVEPGSSEPRVPLSAIRPYPIPPAPRGRRARRAPARSGRPPAASALGIP